MKVVQRVLFLQWLAVCLAKAFQRPTDVRIRRCRLPYAPNRPLGEWGSTLNADNANERVGARKFRRLPFADCQSVDEVIQLAAENIDELPFYSASVWTSISRLLSRRPNRQPLSRKEDEGREIRQQIIDIIEQTMNSHKTLRPQELTTIILGMAKTAKQTNDALLLKRRVNIYQISLRNFLLDHKSRPKRRIFLPLAEAVNDTLYRFEPRQLSNVAYAFALLRYDQKLKNGSSLLERIALESLNSIDQFNSQDISNMLWAYASLKVPHPPLFQSLGDAVANMPDLTGFKPQALANIVWAFASMDFHHTGLFQKVGDAVVSFNDLELFTPQNLSNLVWAYGTAGEAHPSLFRKLEHAIELYDLNSFKPEELMQLQQYSTMVDSRKLNVPLLQPIGVK
jgi:hypothetical protein